VCNEGEVHQQKNDLHPAEATHVWTDCVRPMRPVRPDSPPDVFSHPMRLVPPNALIPPPIVTGAPYREVNSKVATAPNTQSRR